ncbi:hypothetical protein BG011_000767, partial [Mortierella polycephala]
AQIQSVIKYDNRNVQMQFKKYSVLRQMTARAWHLRFASLSSQYTLVNAHDSAGAKVFRIHQLGWSSHFGRTLGSLDPLAYPPIWQRWQRNQANNRKNWRYKKVIVSQNDIVACTS